MSTDLITIEAGPQGMETVQLSPAQFQQMLKAGGWAVETVLSLEDGKGFEGIYLGPGSDIEMSPDPRTGEIKTIKTWRVQLAPNIVANVVGCYALNRDFSKCEPGKTVAVLRLGQTKSRAGRQVNNFLFAVKTDGGKLHASIEIEAKE